MVKYHTVEPPSRNMQCRTFTGRMVDPLHLAADDVDPADLAHSLAQQARFNGHLPAWMLPADDDPSHWPRIYSVAAHSLAVSEMLWNATGDRMLRTWGLLHDAAEAYLGDVVRPLKPWCSILDPNTGDLIDVAEVERRILFQVSRRFSLSWPVPEIVAEADRLALACEVAYFWPDVNLADWGLADETLPKWKLGGEAPLGVYLHATCEEDFGFWCEDWLRQAMNS